MKLMKFVGFAILLLWMQSAVAVKEGVFSWTAENMAAYRAISSLHPDEKIRCPDNLAIKLVSQEFWRNSYMRPNDYRWTRDLIDRNAERFSVYFYANARTHHFDKQLVQALSDGTNQVVILGAGLDSRAYRFHGQFPNAVFFEADVPWGIAEKKERVAKLLGENPSHVKYVGVDFNIQTLDNTLPQHGYDVNKKTIFLLEGITMYVNEQGIRATFQFMKKAATGSTVVYDYILEEVVKGDVSHLYGAITAIVKVKEMYEPFVTGWSKEGSAKFLQDFGYALVEDVDHEELTKRYLIGKDGRPDGRMMNWHRIITAKIQ